MKSLKFNTILNAFRMSLTVLVPLITFPYISRIFLTDGSGKINFVNSVVQIFVLFASLGTNIYGTRAGALLRGDRKQLSKLGVELLTINISSSVLTYVVFLFCVFFVPSLADYRGLLLIAGVTIGFTAVNPDWVLGVHVDYTYITVRQIIIQIFTVISIFVFIHKPEDIYLYAALSTFSTVISVVMTFVFCRKYITFLPDIRCKYDIRQHLHPILLLFATSLAAKVYSNIDTVLLGFMADDHSVGLYSAAVKINTILITFFAAMSPIFVPRIVELKEKKNIEEYTLLLKKIFGLIIGLGIPIVVGLEVLGDQIICVIADKSFAPAALTMRILAPIVLINACANVLYYDVLVPYEKENNVLLCTVIGAVVNLLISIAMIPFFKENGAAIGSLIAEIVSLVASVLFCNKLDKRFLKKMPRIYNYLIGSIAIAAWCRLCEKIIMTVIPQILIAIIGSVFLYFIILVILKDFLGREIITQTKKLVRKVFYANR